MASDPPPRVEELPAGRDLDVLVAEQVMGFPTGRFGSVALHDWSRSDYGSPMCKRCGRSLYRATVDGDVERAQEGPCDVYPTPYSTISAAWEVVERISGVGYSVEMESGDDGWRVLLIRGGDFDDMHHGDGQTAPLAICRAALRAVGYKEES